MLEAVTFSEAYLSLSSGKNAERKKRLFLICESCYWTATSLPTRKDDVARCPECQGSIVGLPLSDDEALVNHIR